MHYCYNIHTFITLYKKILSLQLSPSLTLQKSYPPPPPPPLMAGGGGGHTKHSRQEKRKRAKLLSYMYKKSHDMDNAMKILDLSFNERRSYLASSVDFFYVPLLILKTILRFSEKRWRWQLKGSYTSLVMWKILPWGTNKINISRFSSN